MGTIHSFIQSLQTPMVIRMRNASCILVALVALCARPALAQELKITSATLLWYGPYESVLQKEIDDPSSPTGKRRFVNVVPPRINTDQVPAKLKQRFGFGYVLNGSPSGAVVKVKHVRKFPSGGMTNPKSGERFLSYESENDLKIGDKELFIGYFLEEEFQVVPGVWTFRLIYNNRLLLEKNFTVYKPQ